MNKIRAANRYDDKGFIKTYESKQWAINKDNPEMIKVESDNTAIFLSDYFYLKFTASEYCCFTIRILFGSDNFEKPVEGLKAKLSELESITKITRSKQK